MKNPFKRAGFDSLISAGTLIEGSLIIQAGTTMIIDGQMTGKSIGTSGDGVETTVVVNGKASALDEIRVPNITVTGEVSCENLIATGCLSVKKGARVNATFIQYKSLIIEDGAFITGHMTPFQVEEAK